MEDLVILDIMNDVFLPQGRNPENFLLISIFEVCPKGGVEKGGTWRTLRVLDRRLGGPQGRYSENFVLISHLEVCQEGGVKKEGTWEDIGGS